MNARGPRRGFSMVELIMAIGLVGSLLLLVVGIFTTLVSGTQKASDLTRGSTLADGLLSQQIYQVMCTDSVRTAFFKESYSEPEVYRQGACSLNNVLYSYKIYCQDVAMGAKLHCTDTDGTAGQTLMKRLDVVVTWNDTGEGAIVQGRGMGVQKVQQTRLLWPNGSY